MKFPKQAVIWILAASQLSLAANGWSADVTTTTQDPPITPELELVQNFIEVFGNKLSSQERQDELTQAVSDYNRTATGCPWKHLP